MNRNFIQPMGGVLIGSPFFLCGGRGRVNFFVGAKKGKKYCATCKVIVQCPNRPSPPTNRASLDPLCLVICFVVFSFFNSVFVVVYLGLLWLLSVCSFMFVYLVKDIESCARH